MRGILRIASSRAPYQRAGIGFATKGPQDVDIRTLDGARFLRLINDPVLTLKIGQEDGSFVAMPQVPDGFDGAAAQMLIDSMAEELPDLPAAPIDPVLADGRTLEGLADQLKEAGVATIDELFDKLASTEIALGDAQIALAAVQKELIEANTNLFERNEELFLSRERAAELEAAVKAASSSPPVAEEQPQETRPAPRKAAAKKG